jgi:NADH-quinone oxidoreductase subunit M
MIAVLFILIPLLSGLLAFVLKTEKTVKWLAAFSSVFTLAVVLHVMYHYPQVAYSVQWLPALGSSFSISLDGMGKLLVILTAVAFPAVFFSTIKNSYKNPSSFYALMLLTQAGLMGVVMAADALVFYFFWELALIPVYFLASIWGGPKRIAVTFKFFIYTFLGSLLMLVGILYLYFSSPEHSFAIQSLIKNHLEGKEQNIIFWLFFLAFAVKMPIFPLHTWQPDTYEQSSTAVTMILSAVMVKMGVFSLVRWLIPLFPDAVQTYGLVIIIFSVIGMIYASLIAIKQDDVKRLIAYSSIAHIGLMSAAVFSKNEMGLQGAILQMFNHGIIVLGLWIVIDAIEEQLGTRKISELGGLAQKTPTLAILLVVLGLANIGLPLTNGFIGEFLMFNGLFHYNIAIAVVALISIILAAVYTLNMIQKIFYGNTVALTQQATNANIFVTTVLMVLVILIIVFGVYPQPVIDLTKDTVAFILKH